MKRTLSYFEGKHLSREYIKESSDKVTREPSQFFQLVIESKNMDYFLISYLTFQLTNEVITGRSTGQVTHLSVR